MSKQLPEINNDLKEWISRQKIFFVASAPLSASGHVNCSPKGGDAFRILNPLTVAYHDYTGSGAETIAHLRENGRILIMFCGFEGGPRIVRLHGTGIFFTPESPEFAELAKLFPENPGTRAIIRVAVSRISTSCGYAVPFFDFREPRETLDKHWEAKGADKLAAYHCEKNSRSIDGLPALAE